MNLIDELQKLEQLHKNGSLTAEEFSKAKTLLLSSSESANSNTDFISVKAYIDHETQIRKLDAAWENQKKRFMTEQMKKSRPLISWSFICGIVWALALFNWNFGYVAPEILNLQRKDSSILNFAKSFLPVLSVLVFLPVIWLNFRISKTSRSNVISYKEALKAYQDKRRELLNS